MKKIIPWVIISLMSCNAVGSEITQKMKYLEKKKSVISKRTHDMRAQRAFIREEIRRQRLQREEEERFNRCLPDRRELITVGCGLASIGITTLRMLLELIK